MSRSKKIFLALAAVFFAAMIYIGYDISSRTTFPGSKPQLKERLLNSEESEQPDSLQTDSIKNKQDSLSL